MSEKPITEQLKALRVHADFTMEQMAEGLGYSRAPSYQRYENPAEFKKSYLPPTMVGRIANMVVGRGDPPITAEEVYLLAGPELLEYARVLNNEVPDAIGGRQTHSGMYVRGEVAAGVFLRLDHVDEFKYEPVPIGPSPQYPEHAQFALKIKGNSLNKVAKDKDYLLCVDLEAAGVAPRHGDIVVVERTRAEAGEIEVSAKRLEVQNDGTWLLQPESDDPRHQEPLRYETDDADDDGVKVKITAVAIIQLGTLRSP